MVQASFPITNFNRFVCGFDEEDDDDELALGAGDAVNTVGLLSGGPSRKSSRSSI